LTLRVKLPINGLIYKKRAEGLIRNTGQNMRIKNTIRPLLSMLFANKFL